MENKDKEKPSESNSPDKKENGNNSLGEKSPEENRENANSMNMESDNYKSAKKSFKPQYSSK